MSEKIFVVCDHPSHAPRVIAVTNFVSISDDGWHEIPASRAAVSNVGTGHHLVGDDTTESGWANDPSVTNESIRTRHDLTCRKCPTRPFSVRSEKLYAALKTWASTGAAELSLAALAAILEKQAETPESGQG